MITRNFEVSATRTPRQAFSAAEIFIRRLLSMEYGCAVTGFAPLPVGYFRMSGLPGHGWKIEVNPAGSVDRTKLEAGI